MKKQFYWIAACIIVLMAGAGAYWTMWKQEPLSQAGTFVYKEDATLYWLEIRAWNGKVTGKLHQQTVMEKPGENVYMEKHTYPLNGKKDEDSYRWTMKKGSSRINYQAHFSGRDLMVKEEGDQADQRYKAADKADLVEEKEAIQKKLQTAIDQAEEKEKERLRNFFTEFNHVYRYLYTAEDQSFQLVLKVEEALLQGEVSCTLLKVTPSQKGDRSYQTEKYELNGISDGNMIELFTTVNGEKKKLTGHFYGGAEAFDLSYWEKERKLLFQAVTEKEFAVKSIVQ